MRRNKYCLFDDLDASPNICWYFFCNATTFNVPNCSIAATTVWAMFVLSPVMNYSHMDALLASDSKPQFDLDAMSPGTLEGRDSYPAAKLSRPCSAHPRVSGEGTAVKVLFSARRLTLHEDSIG